MPNLVGIGLSQVPTNSMLGGLAYQDPEHASIKDLDLKNLSQINSEISDTARDVFVYDTRKDSDGGAWRKRTQHTSWYNETLGTATRGTRKEFPAVAVLVLEAGKLTIYDGDDPDLPMWMVFNNTGSNISIFGRSLSTRTSVEMLNGLLVIGGSYSGAHFEAFTHINFISEKCQQTDNTGTVVFHKNISQRGETSTYSADTSSFTLVNIVSVNDVAMTVLPNAPVDDTTGLPVPTIAVGVGNAGSANGGVSVIKDDGSVVDIIANTGAGGYASYNVEFGSNNELIHTQAYNESYASVNIFDDIPSSDISATNSYSAARSYLYVNGVPDIRGGKNGGSTPNLEYVSKSSNGDIAFGFQNTDAKLSLLSEPKGAGAINQNSAVAYIASDYNTGWMIGHTKGAFMSDTDTTNLVGTNLVSNGTFDSNTTGWSSNGNITVTQDAGRLKMVSGSGNPFVYTAVTCVVGKRYYVQLDVQGDVSFHAGPNASSSGDVAYIPYSSHGSLTTKHCFFVATATTMYLVPHVIGTGNTGYIDNVICKLADHDRTRNGAAEANVGGVNGRSNGLVVYGTITKQPVATGAELVSYSGWSSSNYLRQPYISDLDFGTGNWCYMFWYNPNDAESGDVIFSRWSYNVDSQQGPRVTAYLNSGNLRVDTADASAGSGYQGHFGSDGTQDSNEWHCAVILRRGPNLEIWIDGVNYKNATLNSTSDGSYTDTNSILEIGHSPNSGAPEAGLELALFRVSGTAPSPEQIKKMYNDEKHLFQENAKATLYGSSNAVTGLAHDDSTDSLHVGTSAGRSEFQGLRRINNTTTAVTTAISASNGLVAEQ